MARKRAAKRAAPVRAAKRTARVRALDLLETRVPGLDEVLGGGLPALSFNLIAGGPGAGKTTLAMQVLFANATRARPGLFFTLLGETSLKMLRYQQRFSFFELDRVGTEVHFVNLSEEALAGDLDGVLARIIEEVDRLHPGVVVVDSFRSLMHSQGPDKPTGVDYFVQRLALHLTTWDVTSFLIGEYDEQEFRNPVFTVADGIAWLTQAVDRNSMVRKLQVVKSRGMDAMPGLHTMRITKAGVQVFPRIPNPRDQARPVRGPRMSTGIAGLDEMMGGGIAVGDSLVLAGPAGSGKTTFAVQFIAAGLRAGESAVIAVFEEHPEVYLERAKTYGVDFRAAIKKGKLRIIYLRPLDLSVDETLSEIRTAVEAIGASRVVIDSITGFEIALAPTFREDFRESLYRLIGALTGLGVTIYSTVELLASREMFPLTGYQISFLTDEIINQRFVEIEGELRRVLTVVKMRGSNHSREFRLYDITNTGVLLRESLRDYDAISTGTPTRQLRLRAPSHSGLTDDEVLVLETIIRSGTQLHAGLVARTGMPPDAIDAILQRLIQLDYISRTGSHYQGTARPPSP
jgi:circadian clock protein KaiC